MKHTLIFILLISSLSVFAQGEKNFIDQNYIEITGKAEMQIVPDLIYLKIIISEKDTKNKIPVAELERKMIAKFQDIGIDVKKDLMIDDLSSYYKNKLLGKTDVILSKEYQLIVHDGKTASKVLVELEKIEISNVSVVRVDHSKIEDFKKEVKVNAIKAAKEKAELLTKAVGQNVGRAIYIQDYEMPTPIRYSSVSMRLKSYDSAPAREEEVSDLEFEKIKLESSILVRFELK
jgi:uncharacterized protein YggE